MLSLPDAPIVEVNYEDIGIIRNALREFPMFFAVAASTKEVPTIGEIHFQALMRTITREVGKNRNDIATLVRHEINSVSKKAADAFLADYMSEYCKSRDLTGL
jgi:hypothetical protein